MCVHTTVQSRVDNRNYWIRNLACTQLLNHASQMVLYYMHVFCQWVYTLQLLHTANLVSTFLSAQTLCTECGQKLSDAELKMVKQEPVAKKMAILEQQYEALQVRT